MRCCPRSPFLSPLWAEMPYHRFGNSVVQHRAHPVETLRRMARRHSRPSPRPYMRTGRSGVRPDGVFHLGRHRHSRHAVKARRIVRTDVRTGRCYTALLHDGIRSSRGICRDLCHTPLSAQRRYLFHRHCRSHGRHSDTIGACGGKSGEARLVYTGNAAIITGILLLVFAHNIPCYLLLWQHCWDTVSELCSLPCRPWSCLPKDEVPQALRFSWLSISGLHWEDFSRITREIPGI